VTQVSTHVLDTAGGRPAAGVPVSLQGGAEDGSWTEIGTAITDEDGRADGLAGESGVGPGVYLLIFDTDSAFFEQVVVTFTVTDADERLHIPLLLSPYGYTVYRGS
jgi:5-hydroxyisourate hydrolase